MNVTLYAPTSYVELTEAERLAITGPIDVRFPDDIFGVSFKPARNIHDYMYAIGEDKDEADWTFLCNMLSIVKGSGGPLEFTRRQVAYFYFETVR